jgi:CubicO group peptidase (beta-lactamase class C family)
VVDGSEGHRDFTAIDATIDEFVRMRGLDGAGFIVVDADEGVVHEHYVGVFAPDRISLVASSSKMVTAGVLARLDDDGVLDLDAPVADIVEWGAGNPDVTPAQLVSNSSGLVGLLPDPAYSPYVCQFLSTGSMQECAEQIFTTPDDDAEIVPPDTQFRYGGGQWQVAGAVAEVASGKTWAELVEEIYVEPCGLETLGYNNHFAEIGARGFTYPDAFDGDLTLLQPTDNPNMEGGMYTTTGDYAELLLMHLRGGRCGDEQVLSQTALDRLHADRIGGIYGSVGPGTGYGMGWWIDRDSGRIYDPGAYGSVPWLDLADGYGAYIVIEADAVTGSQLAGELYDPLDDVMAADG